MSGGYFTYRQRTFEYDVIEKLERTIGVLKGGEANPDDDITEMEADPKTIGVLEDGLNACKVAVAYIDAIDLLLSGDCSEESFRDVLEVKLAVARAADLDESPMYDRGNVHYLTFPVSSTLARNGALSCWYEEYTDENTGMATRFVFRTLGSPTTHGARALVTALRSGYLYTVVCAKGCEDALGKSVPVIDREAPKSKTNVIN